MIWNEKILYAKQVVASYRASQVAVWATQDADWSYQNRLNSKFGCSAKNRWIWQMDLH